MDLVKNEDGSIDRVVLDTKSSRLFIQHVEAEENKDE